MGVWGQIKISEFKKNGEVNPISNNKQYVLSIYVQRVIICVEDGIDCLIKF